MHDNRLQLVVIWSFLFLTACGAAPATEDERGSADREARKANYFGASGAAFSPDGRLVAVGTRDTIWVADTSTLKTKAHLGYQKAGYFGGKKSLQFIDDHRLLVGADGAILLWDLREYTVTDRINLPGSTYSPRAMAWSPATQMLAFSVGAHDSTVKLIQFDGSGFGNLRNFPMFDGIPADLEFSSDGRYLAAAGDGSGVFIREVTTGLEAGVLPTGGYVNELDLFGDRKLMVSGAEIVFWSFRTEQEAELLENPDLNSQVTNQVITRIVGGIAGGVAIAHLWPILVVGGADFVSPMVQVFRENPVKTAPDSWCGRSTTITPDGRLMADIYPGITREVIRVIDLRSGELVKSLDPRGENSCAARFSPDGSLLLVTTDKEARLYSTATWRYRDLDLH